MGTESFENLDHISPDWAKDKEQKVFEQIFLNPFSRDEQNKSLTNQITCGRVSPQILFNPMT